MFGAVQRAVREALVARSPVPAGARSLPLPDLALAPEPWTPPLWERAFRREGAVSAAATRGAGHSCTARKSRG